MFSFSDPSPPSYLFGGTQGDGEKLSLLFPQMSFKGEFLVLGGFYPFYWE